MKKSNSLTELDKVDENNNINKWNMSCNDVKYDYDEDIEFLSNDYTTVLNNTENILESSTDSLEECNIYRLNSIESTGSSGSTDSLGNSKNSTNSKISSKKLNNIKNVIYINNIIENIKIFKDTNEIDAIKTFDPFINRYTYGKYKNNNKCIGNDEYLCY